MPEVNFFWDNLSDNILQERDETGAVTASYTTEPDLYGNLLRQNRGGVVNQYHFDPQGSTLALTDDNQQVTDTYAYSAFGEVSSITGTQNSYQYQGQQGCRSNGFTNVVTSRREDFSPSMGRWLVQDENCPRSGLNAYSCFANHPTENVDASGTCDRTISDETIRKQLEEAKTAVPKVLGAVATCTQGRELFPVFGFIPETNGCSVPAGLQGLLLGRNKDCPAGAASFLKACTTHDICYQTCGKVKEKCDRQFLDDMVAACNDVPAGTKDFNYDQCIAIATTYFSASLGFANTDWSWCQLEACQCCYCGMSNCISATLLPSKDAMPK